MDDSMNSVHSVSAMDISPASSPKLFMASIPPNHLVLNTFQQQHELLSNALFTTSQVHDHHRPLNNGLPTAFTNQIDDLPEETNQIRQRIVETESILSPVQETVVTSKSQPKSSVRLLSQILSLISVSLLFIYLAAHYSSAPITIARSTHWQNASDYLIKHLIGQEQGLVEFKGAMKNHRNVSIVLIAGPTGTGKTYLASSIEKFIPTTLISTNTLLGLPSHHWSESDRLVSYLLSHLSPSTFQFLILDDLDLLPMTESYCDTLTQALQSIHERHNLFILLLQTKPLSTLCQERLSMIVTTSIRFHRLQRDHIRTCIANEAYIQNVQPPFNDQQVENILDSLQYIDSQGISYSSTGCKQIPSLVMMHSKRPPSFESIN